MPVIAHPHPVFPMKRHTRDGGCMLGICYYEVGGKGCR